MCGIYAIFSNKYNNQNLSELIYGMQKLQHRGKDGFGICITHSSKKMIQYQNEGMVNKKNTFLIRKKKSFSCLGHVRYLTSGITNNGEIIKNKIQPIFGKFRNISYFLAHNGNIPDVEGHDTLFINQKIMESQKKNLEEVLIELMNSIPAAYNLIIMTNKNMYAVRDRFGIRPLCFGKSNSNFYISSESFSLPKDSYIRDVKPGEIIRFNKEGFDIIYQHEKTYLSLCSFEIIYFLNENNFTDGIYIKNIRKFLGGTLAIREKILIPEEKYIVIGIPKTGIIYGIGYAKEMNYKYKQLIKKKKNIRSFIGRNNKERQKTNNEVFIYDKPALYGEKIVIVDDTIVRGNVIKSIISNLRKCNVLEIHVRIPSPPVIDICELGISIRSKNELIINNKTILDVCKEIDADSLCYLSPDDLWHFPEKSYNQCFSGFIDKELKIN